MRILNWLLERHPGYQMLRERLTAMSDRAQLAERRVAVLEEKLEVERAALLAEKDKWTEYVAVLTNRPPVIGVREWVEKQQAALREQQSRSMASQEVLLNAARRNQLARDQARAEFEQQLPDYVEEKYKAAEVERQRYFNSVRGNGPVSSSSFFDAELSAYKDQQLEAMQASHEMAETAEMAEMAEMETVNDTD